MTGVNNKFERTRKESVWHYWRHNPAIFPCRLRIPAGTPSGQSVWRPPCGSATAVQKWYRLGQLGRLEFWLSKDFNPWNSKRDTEIKAESLPVTCHEDIQERGCTAPLILNLGARWGCVGGQPHAPCFTLEKEALYRWYRRLRGPQDRPEQVWRRDYFLRPPAFEPRTINPVAGRYTDSAVRMSQLKEYFLSINYIPETYCIKPRMCIKMYGMLPPRHLMFVLWCLATWTLTFSFESCQDIFRKICEGLSQLLVTVKLFGRFLLHELSLHLIRATFYFRWYRLLGIIMLL
jgi:hypothetical protein